MYRRKVTGATAAIFAIGVSFAAQPTSLRADWGDAAPQQVAPWVPGTNSLMSVHESSLRIRTPPR